VKLLLDANLSPRLVGLLAGSFDEIAHVRELDLAAADDAMIRAVAADRGFLIVTMDSDFNDLAYLQGAPPKIAWLRLGNVSTARVAEALEANAATIAEFSRDAEAAVLTIIGPR